MFPALISPLMGWISGKGSGLILKVLGGAFILAIVAMLVNDYQERGRTIALQADKIEQQAQIHAAEMAAGKKREAQLCADLVLQKEVAGERMARNIKLAGWIAEMKTVVRNSESNRRPEYALCPDTGPAVTFAFDRLRSALESTGAAD
ncbi:MAG: hypothetical protein ACNI27_12975 [Desulfovibrio sp.]